jgi:hypothetical protein
MIRTRIVATKSATVILALAAIASTSANALPHFGGVHRHPAAQDGRVTLHLYNKAPLFRDVNVDGHVYTVLPHQSLLIKAPAGTPVYTETTGGLHTKGDLLFSVGTQLQNATVSID